jgi:DNA repair protein RecO (recombination protein O)
MTLKQDFNLAYVLHTRAYSETSLLVEMLSQDQGRITAVARGAKRGKAKTSSLLQPFMPLQVSWYGKGDLVTLTTSEACGSCHKLYGKLAICGLYVNELLVKLLPRWDACPLLFAGYQETLLDLENQSSLQQITLRKFELLLLKSLGYELQLTRDITTGKRIDADSYYSFDPVLGPKLVYATASQAIKGASLLALDASDFKDPTILFDIKRLMRSVLNYHLGSRRLVTRELL